VEGAGVIHECTALRDRAPVFRDRAHAGREVAALLGDHIGRDARILAIPAGGVPVAVALAEELHLPVGVAVVSKVTLPWNTEAGYGAVAFDGSVELNHPLIAELGLDDETVRAGVDATREKVARRVAAFRETAGLGGAEIVLVDDGLASGFTMRTAVEAVRKAGAARVAAAVPTGSLRAVRGLAERVDDVFCANVRTGMRFAVADAYEHWRDVPEARAVELLAGCEGDET
jgi:predicted phosphoribosyltransferase